MGVLLKKDDLRIILCRFVCGLAAGYACSDYDYLAVVSGMFQELSVVFELYSQCKTFEFTSQLLDDLKVQRVPPGSPPI